MSQRNKAGKVDAVAALYWQIQHCASHIPWPMREYRFHDTREWRLDLCWPAPHLKVGIEVDGGIWRRGGGAHTGTGHIRDIRKGNAATICGYRVLHFIPEDIMDSRGRHVLVALDDVVALFKTLGFKETK